MKHRQISISQGIALLGGDQDGMDRARRSFLRAMALKSGGEGWSRGGVLRGGFLPGQCVALEDNLPLLGIPMKVVSDSDLIPVTGSEVKPGVFGAKRRWRSYGA